MWIWLVAIILLILTWLVFYWLPIAGKWNVDENHVPQPWLPQWLCILLSVVAVLLIVGYYVLRKVREIRKAQALERELMRQAEEQAKNARPDRRAEIIDLQAQVQKGLQALKKSGAGKGKGGGALYSLPWYMIIGPPGAGKTTALRHSGLSFPVETGKVTGVGGTKNCDWWFTNDAILLDTAGRYATEADDAQEWLAFLGMLKKYRSRKPINGVIVGISVTDLMMANEDAIDTFAKKLRARMDEVMTRLQLVVPVYVMFTKVDLVAGFVEYWSDLRKSERQQLWGATFPLKGANLRDPQKSFEAAFDAIVQVVHARALRRIGTERQWESRQKIYQFPIEFQSLRANLGEFIGGLFQKNNFQETPIFRGVYFSSGTQEGRPMDRVMAGMLSAFNIAPGVAAIVQPPQPSTESKSYFVTDVFKKVVFPDQAIAGLTKAEQRRQVLNRLYFAAAVMLVAAVILLPALFTFANNRALLSDAQRVVEKAKEAKPEMPPVTPEGTGSLDRLEPMLKLVAELRDPDMFRYGWGMFVGDDFAASVRKAYIKRMDDLFGQPTKGKLEASMKALIAEGAAKLNRTKYRSYFDHARIYLEACDGNPAHRDNNGQKNVWLVAALIKVWDPATVPGKNKDGSLTTIPAPGYPTDAAEANHRGGVEQVNVNNYIDVMDEDAGKEGAPLWVCDDALVQKAREVLLAFDDSDYRDILKMQPPGARAVSRETLFKAGNNEFGDYVSSKSNPPKIVPPIYTKLGWLYLRVELDENRVEADVKAQAWVLSGKHKDIDRAIETRKKALLAFRESYFKNYVQAWLDLLSDLRVKTPREVDPKEPLTKGAIQVMEALVAKKGYETLLQTVKDNTVLDDEPENALSKLASRGGGMAATGANNLIKNNQYVQQGLQQGILLDGGVPSVGGPAAPTRKALLPEQKLGPFWSIGDKGDATDSVISVYYNDVHLVYTKLVQLRDDARSAATRTDLTQRANAQLDAALRNIDRFVQTQPADTKEILNRLLKSPVDYNAP